MLLSSLGQYRSSLSIGRNIVCNKDKKDSQYTLMQLRSKLTSFGLLFRACLLSLLALVSKIMYDQHFCKKECQYVGIFHDFFKQITSSFSFCEKDIVQIDVIHRRNIATLVIPYRLPHFNFGLSKSKWYLQRPGIKRSFMYHVALNWLFLIKVKNESEAIAI